MHMNCLTTNKLPNTIIYEREVIRKNWVYLDTQNFPSEPAPDKSILLFLNVTSN